MKFAKSTIRLWYSLGQVELQTLLLWRVWAASPILLVLSIVPNERISFILNHGFWVMFNKLGVGLLDIMMFNFVRTVDFELSTSKYSNPRAASSEKMYIVGLSRSMLAVRRLENTSESKQTLSHGLT